MSPTSKQSTWIAALFVILVGAIVVVALRSYPIDGFLKVWAVIGTLVGVLTGAIPSFFFSRAAAQAQDTAAKATDAAREAQGTASQASQAHAQSQERVQTLLSLAQPQLLQDAQRARPDLFAAGSSEQGDS